MLANNSNTLCSNNTIQHLLAEVITCTQQISITEILVFDKSNTVCHYSAIKIPVLTGQIQYVTSTINTILVLIGQIQYISNSELPMLKSPYSVKILIAIAQDFITSVILILQ